MGHKRDIPRPLLWDTKGTLRMGYEWDIINGTWMGHRIRLIVTFSSYETMLKYGFPPYRLIIESAMKTFYFDMIPTKSVPIT